jgi:ferrous iron transport protein B
MVLALNQMDEAKRRGISIDTAALSHAIGMPIIETVAVNSQGVNELRALLDGYAQQPPLAAGEQSLTLSDRQESVEALYAEIESLIRQYVIAPAHLPRWQDRLDALVMHPLLGLVVLFSILLVIFQAVFAWASPAVDLIDAGFSGLGELVGTLLPDGILKDFIVEGLIAGVGGVLVFLPQIIILFFFIRYSKTLATSPAPRSCWIAPCAGWACPAARLSHCCRASPALFPALWRHALSPTHASGLSPSWSRHS